MFEPVPD